MLMNENISGNLITILNLNLYLNPNHMEMWKLWEKKSINLKILRQVELNARNSTEAAR